MYVDMKYSSSQQSIIILLIRFFVENMKDQVL